MPDLAGELQGVIAAAEDAIRAHGTGTPIDPSGGSPLQVARRVA